MLVVGKINILALISLSREYGAAGTPGAFHFRTSGALAPANHYWTVQMTAVFFILGGFAFYLLLYRSQPVPRFIPVWGFIAVACLTIVNLLPASDAVEGFHPTMLLYLPIVLNELFVGGWLTVKGFESPAPGSA